MNRTGLKVPPCQRNTDCQILKLTLKYRASVFCIKDVLYGD